MKTVTILVLNDGETFTDIDGCSICIIPEDQYNDVIYSGGDASDFTPLVKLQLSDVTPNLEN